MELLVLPLLILLLWCQIQVRLPDVGVNFTLCAWPKVSHFSMLINEHHSMGTEKKNRAETANKWFM